VLHARSAPTTAPAPTPAPVVPATRRTPSSAAPLAAAQATATAAPAPVAAAEAPAAPARPEIAWRHSTAIGAPHAGRLENGVQLPVEGTGWVTWDPARDRSPNRALRLYGTDRLVRMLLSVVEDYEAAHPDAPRLVVGDLSWRRGGPMDQHVSHQNGLDVDVYYPRKDGKPIPAPRVSQVDLRLAQDLVDRFAAAGAQVMFVGLHTHLHGPAGVVVPYPNHDDHVHVRIAHA
jgi:murein endopeptidase